MHYRLTLCFTLILSLLVFLAAMPMVSGQVKKKKGKGPKKFHAITDKRIQGHGSLNAGDSCEIDAESREFVAELDTNKHTHLGVHASKVWFKNYRKGDPTIPELPPCNLTPITVPSGGDIKTWVSAGMSARVQESPAVNNNTLVVWAYYSTESSGVLEFTYQRHHVPYKGIPMTYFEKIDLDGQPLLNGSIVEIKDLKKVQINVATDKYKGYHAHRIVARIYPNKHVNKKHFSIERAHPTLPAKWLPQKKITKTTRWRIANVPSELRDKKKAGKNTLSVAPFPDTAGNTLVVWAFYKFKGKEVIEQTSVRFNCQTRKTKVMSRIQIPWVHTSPLTLINNPALNSDQATLRIH